MTPKSLKSQSQDYKIPFSSLVQYVPQNLRNPVIKSLIENLFDRFMTHDESAPLFGYVGRKHSSPDDKTIRISQPTVDRDINAVVPVISFNLGTAKEAFTIQDLINKARIIGVQPNDLNWLYSKSNNYVPPIDIDKFSNFFNYFWVSKSLPSAPLTPWNAELLPEYYCIARPGASDSIKANVILSTTRPIIRTGSGFNDQSFTILFSSSTTFTITADAALVSFSAVGLGASGANQFTFSLSAPEESFSFNVKEQNGPTITLMKFSILREPIFNADGESVGIEEFEAGDSFKIDTVFLSTGYSVIFTGTAGVKGRISSVQALNEFQVIDGVRVQEGQRVLVQSNTASENGIYIVSAQAWERSFDYLDSTAVPGAKVHVSAGAEHGGYIFTSGEGNSWTKGTVPQDSLTNDWQEGNFWFHADELKGLNLIRSGVVQAVRPIIEYHNSIQLNTRVLNGAPTDQGLSVFKQVKTEFNELPLFDLFRYDGTHASKVSSIFFYVQDLSAELDLDLQKRVKLSYTDSADYIFNHGLADSESAEGSLLFYKSEGVLKTIWHAGHDESVLAGQIFKSVSIPSSDPIEGIPKVKGSLESIQPKFYTQQQVWTLTAISETEFSISGSKTTELPLGLRICTVGTPYESDDFSCVILGGTEPFEPGDSFLFRVGNLEFPRYVYRTETDDIFDLYGGPTLDVTSKGAFSTPRPFIYNPYNESSAEVLEGTLHSHFKGILQNQFDTSFGVSADYAFGGSIKNWSEQQTLLASILMQRDLTPISAIDLAQRQYEIGLNTISDIYLGTIIQYFSTVGVVDIDGSVQQYDKLEALLDSILLRRALDNDSRTVLYDTTSTVLGFPITLPALGILSLTPPSISFDNILGRQFLTHHDGHNSVLSSDDLEFRKSLFNASADLMVVRSDGTKTTAIGSDSAISPSRPYKGTLWLRPGAAGASTLYAFDVHSDYTAPLSPALNETWFNRTAGAEGELNIWDGLYWVKQSSHDQCWRSVNLADTKNELLLLVETRLYQGINPNNRKVDFESLRTDPAFNLQLKRELFTFAAANNLDPLGIDYRSTNALTWNYSRSSASSFNGVMPSVIPARWHKVLLAHQASVGVLGTVRPNLEPWKLLNFETEREWLNTLNPETIESYTPYATSTDLTLNPEIFIDAGTVRAVKREPGATVLYSLQIVDGIQLNSGDKVLLQNEVGAENNGIWLVSTGAWTRSNISLLKNTYVRVQAGRKNQDSLWCLTSSVDAPGSSPAIFKQIRLWSDSLWSDIKAARPGLILSVDTVHDYLLAPYVGPGLDQSSNALTNIVPSGISSTYDFGDEGPVEEVWLSTVDYGYGLAKALFRHDPLLFLGFCWGFNWVEVDSILYDGFDLTTPGHKRFKLHGDDISKIDRAQESFSVDEVQSAENIDLTFTYDAYEVQSSGRYQNFSIRRTGTRSIIGFAREGLKSSINTGPYNNITLFGVLIEDFGLPFRTGDSFRLIRTENSPVKIIFIPVQKYQFLGFGQSFTVAFRASTIDTTDSYAVQAFRGWDVNMGYRAGALIRTDDLKVSTSNDSLSTSSFDLIIKKNNSTKDIWVQGLRITVLQFGENIEVNGAFKPKARGADWVFRIEGYNPRYSNISYFDLDTTGDSVSFNVLDSSSTDLSWDQFTSETAVLNSHLPLSITGIQNVINFLFGYSSYVVSEGWIFNLNSTTNVDSETGRVRTWQLEIEKFIDRCYKGLRPDQGHIVNPFMDSIWIRGDDGVVSEFKDTALFDITGTPGIFDVAGLKFNSSDLFVIRGSETQISGTAPIFSAHAQLDQFEHLFIFKNNVENNIENGVLYDPFSGSRVVSYNFNGRRQAQQNFRPEFGGHYIVGNEVRQNLQSSTDNITNFYDSNRAFENNITTKHSLALLGFSTKSYFGDLDISDKSQLNFWRGLIQAKGTNTSISAYLNSNRFEDAKIDEYWAYKISEFGDSRQRTFPELKLSVSDSVQQFTQLQFDALQPILNFTQISRFDEDRWFSIEDLDQDTYFKAEIIGTYTTIFTIEEIYPIQIELPFLADTVVISGPATKLNASTIIVSNPGTVSVIGYGPATPRYNPVKLFNYASPELVEEIPMWHPAIGQHTPTALESINVISSLNPAKYNFSTQVVNNNSFDPLRPWGEAEIGIVWFDTKNLSYLPYSDETIFENLPERLSRWGAVSDFSTIDVHEWVKSTVPPSQYNTLSKLQAGDADLDPSTKAGGEVSLQETYVRNRLWNIRPISWSYSPIPTSLNFGSTPPFSASFNSKLNFERTGFISLELGTFSSFNIEPGMRIGAWRTLTNPPAPLSEYIIENNRSKVILYNSERDQGVFVQGSELYPSSTASISVNSYTNVHGALIIEALTSTGTELFSADGTSLNQFSFIFSIKIEAESGEIETVQISEGISSSNSSDGTRVSPTSGETLLIPLTTLGLTLNLVLGEVPAGTEYSGHLYQNMIVQALNSSVTVLDAISVTPVVQNSSEFISIPISNDPLDPEFTSNNSIGWRAWSVPTQAELTADGKQPVCSWRAYEGDFNSTSGTLQQIQDAVLYSKAPLTLNNGKVIERYNSTWTDWEVLKNIISVKTQGSTSGTIEFTASEAIVPESTSMYLNGISQLKASFDIEGSNVSLKNAKLGSTGTMIIRKYEPSIEELSFDPTVQDDLTFQLQYKKDYEYVSTPVRDNEGSISSTVYYFWVKNKSAPAASKKLSVKAISEQLSSGPPNFLTFQNLLQPTSALPFRYDAITISGLSYIIGKDDTFKLRFTRNFTLRDDPQDLDLKDTHSEWSLIRPGQRTKIPESLWQKVLDSASGQDAAGSPIPALRRTLYDDRKGTRTQFGFNSEQTLAPKKLLVSSIIQTIVNTQLINKSVPANSDGVYPADFISFLNFDESDLWFSTPALTRKTLTDIWTTAKPSQINEIFFAVLNDILASNYELTNIFKTSRLSAYSIKVIPQSPIKALYE